MELNYDFVSPRQIVFGWGRRREVGQAARGLGRRAFLIVGSRSLEDRGFVDQIVQSLAAEGIGLVNLGLIDHEPEVADVDRMSATVRALGPGEGDFFIALGGGAAIDLAKALAAMATNTAGESVKDYLEGVGRGLQLLSPPLKILAMPTTAGTGAEATRNAVISSYNPPFKKSLRDPRLVPQVALIDPELAVGLPPSVTAASGMDAITQLIESYISLKARPIPRALAVDGLRLALPAIEEAVHRPENRPAREAMSQAALLSGISLANAGLGMAHGVAAALGVAARVPHGVACAMLLPATLRANLAVAREHLAELARRAMGVETSDDEAAALTLIGEIERLCRAVDIPPRLRDVGVVREQLDAIVAGAAGSSMSGNPRPLDDGELKAILEGMW